MAVIALQSDIGLENINVIKSSEEDSKGNDYLVKHLESYLPQRVLKLYETRYELLSKRIIKIFEKTSSNLQEKSDEDIQVKFNAEKQFIGLCKRWFPDTYYDMFFEITFEYKELLFRRGSRRFGGTASRHRKYEKGKSWFGACGAHIITYDDKLDAYTTSNIKYEDMTQWATNEDDQCFFYF